MSKDAFKFLTSYLATFLGDDSHVLSEAKEEAACAIVEFVRAPDIFQVPCPILIMMFGRLYDLTASYIVQLELDKRSEEHTSELQSLLQIS